MTLQVITGNHAAGYALSTAGEANRTARGVACGIYPITPQTEIVEKSLSMWPGSHSAKGTSYP
jgi:pyruvate/2-oxoacid:ferredoxin oxidoreductase alpha subunit